MKLIRLIGNHKLLAGFTALCTLSLAGTAISYAAATAPDVSVTVVNNNIAVIIGHNFTAGSDVQITVTAGSNNTPLTAPAESDGRFGASSILPDGYSGAVTVTAKQGSLTATGRASASGTGSTMQADPSPVPSGDVSQQAAGTTGTAAGGAGNNPSGEGTTAATTHKWGTPIQNYDFTSLDGWSVYDNGDKIDFGLKRKQNVTVSGGILTLKGENDGHTGGMAAQFSQEFGRWEVRMKATHDKACWRPVILLWPDEGDDTSPGEIDYSESDGSLKQVNFFLHYPNGEQTSESINVDQTQWHNYAVEWTADHVAGFVDGKEFFRTTDPNQIPKTPFHETFQLDAQGHGELCDGNAQMQVDWHRVYAP